LKLLIDDFDLCENTPPIVGATPDSVIPPDEAHIAEVLDRRKPDVVIACGKQAETALLKAWPGPLLAIPHPAHRLLTDQLYKQARIMLTGNYKRRSALRQCKGLVEMQML
jgi:hypothetical protein